MEGSMKRMLIHSIAAEEFMQKLGVNSKLNADWEFLTHLRDAGRARASEWLAVNFQHLADCGVINPADLALFEFADSPREAWTDLVARGLEIPKE